MNPFSLLHQVVVKNYSLSDFANDMRSALLRGRRTNSGVYVSEDTALRYITVYSCVQVLSLTLGALPLYLYCRRPGGGADEATDHPLYGLLHDSPNDEMPSLTWRESQMGQIALSGNGYSMITRNGRGQVMELYPLDWHQVRIERDQKTRKLIYHVNDRGKEEQYPPDRIFHVPGWGFDGIQGYSPIRMAEEAVGLGMAATEFASRFYGQGINMGIVLTHPGELGTVGRDNLKADLYSQAGGLQRAWDPLILEEGMKAERLAMPLKDAQFLEQQKLNRDEICGLYRVPPHMIANLDKATFSNIEHLSLEFVMYTMLPWVKRWEQFINFRLLMPAERQLGYYAKFNLTALLRGDAQSRANALHIMRNDGIINADEWREMEDMNPQPNGQGKAYVMNGNFVPVGQANQAPQQGGDSGGQ